MKSFSIWFVVWIVTTQCVNIALYLAVTRVAHGWSKILLWLLGFYTVLTATVAFVYFADVRLADTTLFVVSAVALVSFVPMIFHLSSKRQTAERMRLVEDSLRLMVGEVAVHRAAIDAARRQRHDQRHHRIALAEYLLRGQVDKALRYLEQLDEEAGETPTDKLIWCENDTINAILSGCARNAAAKGVAFEVTANVERTVDLPDIDLVALVANLVENAIEAAGGGKVTVALRQRERTVGMTVTNPVPADFALSENGLPCQKPGVGLESVVRVIERHHGELVYTLKDGVLECQAMMRIGRRQS